MGLTLKWCLQGLDVLHSWDACLLIGAYLKVVFAGPHSCGWAHMHIKMDNVQANISADGRQVQCQVIDLGCATKASAREPHPHAILTKLPAIVSDLDAKLIL